MSPRWQVECATLDDALKHDDCTRERGEMLAEIERLRSEVLALQCVFKPMTSAEIRKAAFEEAARLVDEVAADARRRARAWEAREMEEMAERKHQSGADLAVTANAIRALAEKGGGQ